MFHLQGDQPRAALSRLLRVSQADLRSKLRMYVLKTGSCRLGLEPGTSQREQEERAWKQVQLLSQRPPEHPHNRSLVQTLSIKVRDCWFSNIFSFIHKSSVVITERFCFSCGNVRKRSTCLPLFMPLPDYSRLFL